MQNRFKSKVVWLSVASLILLVLKNYGLLDNLGLTVETYNELVDSVIAILVLFGILNNPNSKENF